MDTTSAAFTLEAPPGTDIWKKPPVKNIWNAPISRESSGLLKKFQRAQVTFWADWTAQYDQGGLLLTLKRVSSSATSSSSQGPHAAEKWIKTGVEFYKGQPQLSTVACDRWADWSIGPITRPVGAQKGITLEIVREGDQNGKSAWVYQLVLDEQGDVTEKVPLREICWIFADEDEKDGEEWVLDVSPLVARPDKTAKGNLAVKFSEFKVEWAS